MFFRLYSYLGGAGSACADVASPKHLLVAQDTAAGVLLVVQELLEGVESVLGVGGARNLLQQPADLIWIVFHLEKEEGDVTERIGIGAGSGGRRVLTAHPLICIKQCPSVFYIRLYLNIRPNFLFQHNVESKLLAPL